MKRFLARRCVWLVKTVLDPLTLWGAGWRRLPRRATALNLWHSPDGKVLLQEFAIEAAQRELLK